MEHYGPILEEFLPGGPRRILVDGNGTALSFERAEAEYGITQDEVVVTLVRNDGWSLGAREDLADDAYRLWADEWKWFGVQPCPNGFPIARWPEWRRLRCRATALTWEDLDPTICSDCGREDHANGVLYLRSQCHPEADVEARYEKATGTLRTRCGECGEVTGLFLIGGRQEVGRAFEEGLEWL